MIIKIIIVVINVLCISVAIIVRTRDDPTYPIKGWKHQTSYSKPNQWEFNENRYPRYEYEYVVSDKKTGDHKQHYERRDGDAVRGEYSLVEPGGSVRRVQYNADDKHGFNAIVSRTVNRHGDDAYSIFDFSREYYPTMRSRTNINPYFHEADHAHQEMKTKVTKMMMNHDDVNHKKEENHKTDDDKNIQSTKLESVICNSDSVEQSESSKMFTLNSKESYSKETKFDNNKLMKEQTDIKNNTAILLPIEMISKKYSLENVNEPMMTVPIADDIEKENEENSSKTDIVTASSSYRRKIYFYLY